MYFYCKSLCIIIVVYVFLLFVHVFLTLSMYSYCGHVFLLFVHVLLLLSMYTYCCIGILRRGYPDWGFSVLFPRCKANARVILAKTGHGPHSSNCCVVVCITCFYRSMYCLCVNVYCHRVTTQLQLTNISYIMK